MPRKPSAKIRAAVKKLPWPKALVANDPLTIRDAYLSGQIIATRVREGGDRFAGVSIVTVADVLGASKATVYRAVKVYDVATHYRLEKRLDKVSPTLLHNVERLPEKQRKAFLQRAIREGWSKREIVRRVTHAEASTSSGKGRANLVGDLRNLSQVPLNTKAGTQLTGKERAEARRLVKALSARLHKIAATLG